MVGFKLKIKIGENKTMRFNFESMMNNLDYSTFSSSRMVLALSMLVYSSFTKPNFGLK